MRVQARRVFKLTNAIFAFALVSAFISFANATNAFAEDDSSRIYPTDLNGRTYSNAEIAQNFYRGQLGSTGILGGFHILAFEEFDHKAQAYGNIAVNVLAGSGKNIGHFTTNNNTVHIPTINYIKTTNSDADSINSFYGAPYTLGGDGANERETSILVVGKDVKIEGKRTENDGDRGYVWQFNGSDINNPAHIVKVDLATEQFDNVWKETADGEAFLSFSEAKNDAIYINNEYRKLQSTLVSDEDYVVVKETTDNVHDINKKYIKIANDAGMNVVNLNADTLQSSSVVQVLGFDQNKPSSLVVNIDLKGRTSYELGDGFYICYEDDSKLSSSVNADMMSESSHITGSNIKCLNYKQTYYQYPNHILLNFYDSSKAASGYQYTGDISISRATSTTVIAPSATIHQNVDGFQGSMIANHIELNHDSYYISFNDLTPVEPVAPDTYNLVVKYVWEDGSEAAPTTYTRGHVTGERYSEVAKTMVSYKGSENIEYRGEIIEDGNHDPKEGTFDNKNVFVQFIYKLHTLDVQYVEEKEDGSYVEIDHKDTQYIPEGNGYLENPAEFEGFEYVGLREDSSAIKLEEIYRNEKVIFVYKRTIEPTPETPEEPTPENPVTSAKNISVFGAISAAMLFAGFAISKKYFRR